MTVPNEHGVYEAQEAMHLPRPAKNWRGIPLLEIELVQVEGQWLWGTGLSFWTGDHWGSFQGLSTRSPRAATREQAIVDAARYLMSRIEGRSCHEARLMREWLSALIDPQPQQLDMFGALT